MTKFEQQVLAALDANLANENEKVANYARILESTTLENDRKSVEGDIFLHQNKVRAAKELLHRAHRHYESGMTSLAR
jgi:hypothetical protein